MVDYVSEASGTRCTRRSRSRTCETLADANDVRWLRPRGAAASSSRSCSRNCARHDIVRPTFVTGHPTEISPLARADRRRPLAHRTVRDLRRLARARQRLLRAQRPGREQRARFEDEQAAKDAGDAEARHRRRGLPACPRIRDAADWRPRDRHGPGGDAAGRRVDSIKEVILFPTLPPGTGDQRDERARPGKPPREAPATRRKRRESEAERTMSPPSRMAWGAGLTTEAADGTTLDCWYRWFGWGEYGDR